MTHMGESFVAIPTQSQRVKAYISRMTRRDLIRTLSTHDLLHLAPAADFGTSAEKEPSSLVYARHWAQDGGSADGLAERLGIDQSVAEALLAHLTVSAPQAGRT